MQFNECRCSSPLCAPSRAGLATGLRYDRAGVPDNQTDLDGWRMIFDGRFKYIEHEGRPRKMYDLQSNPEEQAPLTVEKRQLTKES